MLYALARGLINELGLTWSSAHRYKPSAWINFKCVTDYLRIFSDIFNNKFLQYFCMNLFCFSSSNDLFTNQRIGLLSHLQLLQPWRVDERQSGLGHVLGRVQGQERDIGERHLSDYRPLVLGIPDLRPYDFSLNWSLNYYLLPCFKCSKILCTA